VLSEENWWYISKLLDISDFVHCPVFEKNKKPDVSENESVSVLR
jgi:hypothetical protein